jgi:hypothetical protein
LHVKKGRGLGNAIVPSGKFCDKVYGLATYCANLDIMETEYESDHTKFMRELFKKNPQLPEKQLAARGMWWDKKLDREEHKRFKESNVPQKPYVYFGE